MCKWTAPRGADERATRFVSTGRKQQKYYLPTRVASSEALFEHRGQDWTVESGEQIHGNPQYRYGNRQQLYSYRYGFMTTGRCLPRANASYLPVHVYSSREHATCDNANACANANAKAKAKAKAKRQSQWKAKCQTPTNQLANNNNNRQLMVSNMQITCLPFYVNSVFSAKYPDTTKTKLHWKFSITS